MTHVKQVITDYYKSNHSGNVFRHLGCKHLSHRFRIALTCPTFLECLIHLFPHAKDGRDLQQRHFNDQVNKVGQQLLKKVFTSCFSTRD